jgi:hypothetical protein
MARNPHDYAVVVGIDQYPNLPPKRQLQGAVNDAQRFRSWLVSDEGGGLPEGNVYPRPDKPLPPQPTLRHLEELLDPLLELAERDEQAVGRRLYLFYSGHGVAKHLNDARLLSAEYNPASRRSVDFAVLAYADGFSEARAFDEVLVFLDHCRNKDKEVRDPYVHWHFRSDEKGGMVRRFYGLATVAFARARECPWGGGPHLGVFTKALLEGLRGPAADADNNITTDRLRKFLEWRVPVLHQPIQRPDFARVDDFNLGAAPQPQTIDVTVELTEPEYGLRVFHACDLMSPLCQVMPRPGANHVALRLDAPRWYKFATATPRPQTGRRLADILVEAQSDGGLARVEF